MPSIYLKQTGGSYGRDSCTVNVTPGEYQTSNLFKKYTHKFTTSISGEIWLYKERYSVFEFGSSYLALKPDNTHSSAKLAEAHVYFNKHDPDNTPLIFVLIFNNSEPKPENKYYKWSEFKSKFTGRDTVKTSQMSPYTDDNSILKPLLDENDKLENILTYNIGKTQGDSTSCNGNGSDKYNCGKIKVEKDSSIEPKLSSDGFSRYKHTPESGNDGKKACVIYDGNVLLKKNGTEEVPNIQNEQYQCIKVYMGKKAKKTSLTNGGQQIEVPLLIELNKQGPSNEPDYYVHKRKPDGGREYYWEQLPGSDGNTLKDLLTDMGFSTSTGQPGYDQLKNLLKTAGVRVGDEDLDLSQKLIEVTGDKLQAMLGQKVGNGESGSSQKSFLELLLQKIEFDLLDSVIVLLEKKDSSGSYDDGDVSGVILKLEPKREINRVSMTNGDGKKITVSDATGSNGKGQCVEEFGYKLICHDFNSLVNGLSGLDQSSVGIRFIIPNSDDKFKQLMLYNGDKTDPQNLEYIYYKKNGTNGDGTTNQTTVYVWFYNGDDGTGKGDPRPLLLCYGGSAYAPKDKDTYFTEWAKVDLSNGGAGGLKDCGCPQGPAEHVPEYKNKLLQRLDAVVKFLNQVDLKKCTGTSGGSGTQTYEVQQFKGKPIQIKVECSPVGDTSGSDSTSGTCSTSPTTSCYKKFKHTPIGIQNGGDNGSGYRLGEVVYNGVGGGSRKGTLDYIRDSNHKYNPLVGVTVYYYDKDTDYKDPLLIELEFKTNGGVGVGGAGSNVKEYYKLKANGGSNGEKKWELDSKAQDSMKDPPQTQKQVNYLDSIRYSLKKVLKILIEKQRTYDLCLSTNAGGKGDEYKENGNKKIEVEEYKNNGYQKLKSAGYQCYVHKVSELNNGLVDQNP